LSAPAIVVLAAAEVAHHPRGPPLAVDGDDGVHADGLAGTAEVVDRLARPMRPRLVGVQSLPLSLRVGFYRRPWYTRTHASHDLVDRFRDPGEPGLPVRDGKVSGRGGAGPSA